MTVTSQAAGVAAPEAIEWNPFAHPVAIWRPNSCWLGVRMGASR